METNLKKSGRAEHPGTDNWRGRLHEIIFEADTAAGKWFDVALIVCICLSIAAVMLGTVARFQEQWGGLFSGLEWFFTALFTIEYTLRIICIRRPLKYVFSFYGIVDLLSIMPSYLGLVLPGERAGAFAVIRCLRVLRIFRVLKLTQFIGEAELLRTALTSSRRKITVFGFTILMLVTILGSIMYFIEAAGAHAEQFSSIPKSIYWAVVTLTTVGYGDISPATVPGQALAALIMLLGYAIIAVPTGIISVEVSKALEVKANTQCCPECVADKHDSDAIFCNKCGAKLN